MKKKIKNHQSRYLCTYDDYYLTFEFTLRSTISCHIESLLLFTVTAFFPQFTIIPCYSFFSSMHSTESFLWFHFISNFFFFSCLCLVHITQKTVQKFSAAFPRQRTKHNILSMCILRMNWYRGRNTFPSPAEYTSLEFGYFRRNVVFSSLVLERRAFSQRRRERNRLPDVTVMSEFWIVWCFAFLRLHEKNEENLATWSSSENAGKFGERPREKSWNLMEFPSSQHRSINNDNVSGPREKHSSPTFFLPSENRPFDRLISQFPPRNIYKQINDFISGANWEYARLFCDVN